MRWADGGAPARLVVDLEAVCANWRLLGRQAPGARCAAVVKADAYGLGAVPVARALHAADCREFFVAQLEEALALRAALPAHSRLIVLNGLAPGSEAQCAAAGLVPVLNSLDQVARWRSQAARQGRALPAVLQFDSGMARLGLAEHDVERLLERPALLDGIALQLVMSHLAEAELADSPCNTLQLERFAGLRQRFPGVPASLANSSGIFLGRDYHFDLLRPGAALYGIAPRPGTANPMHPVLHLQARLIQVRELASGEHVGYNHTWQADRPSRIATVAIGYADGYPRALGNRAMVAVAGFAVPVVGRVSMDTLTVDVTDLPREVLAPGTWFDVIDRERDVNRLAAWADCSPYEFLTRLGQRFERIHVDGAPAGQRASA